MRILFLGFQAVPYFCDLLNRLHAIPELEIYQVSPGDSGQHLGAGVKVDSSNVQFDLGSLPDRLVEPNRWLGHSDFEREPRYHTLEGIASYLAENRIDCIVVQAIYHDAFCYDHELARTVAARKIPIIFHNIPFQLLRFEEALKASPFPPKLRLRSFAKWGVLATITGAAKLYEKTVRKRANQRGAFLKRRQLLRPDAHVVYHEEGARIYRSYGVDPERIFVVRNSTNTEALNDLCLRVQVSTAADSGNPHRILHVGRLVQWKRVDLLIDALAQLHTEFSNAELVVVGDGPERQRLEEQAKAVGMENQIHFVGAVHDPSELAKQLVNCGIYVLAGMGGLSINDAMTAGLPVICSRCDGTEKFLVRDGENGFIFEEGSCFDLTEKIATLFRDSALAKRMGEESSRIIRDELNLDIVAKNYLRVFQSLR